MRLSIRNRNVTGMNRLRGSHATSPPNSDVATSVPMSVPVNSHG